MAKNKKFAVIPRTPAVQQQGVTTGAGHRTFDGQPSLYVSDAGEAREIEDKYGKSSKAHTVNVVEDDRLGWHNDNDKQTDGHNLSVHHYTFGPSQSYAKAWEAFEKRRVKNEKEK